MDNSKYILTIKAIKKDSFGNEDCMLGKEQTAYHDKHCATDPSRTLKLQL